MLFTGNPLKHVPGITGSLLSTEANPQHRLEWLKPYFTAWLSSTPVVYVWRKTDCNTLSTWRHFKELLPFWALRLIWKRANLEPLAGKSLGHPHPRSLRLQYGWQKEPVTRSCQRVWRRGPGPSSIPVITGRVWLGHNACILNYSSYFHS